VSKGENCKESGGLAVGGRGGPFDKYNDRKFLEYFANNYTTDIMRLFFLYTNKYRQF